MLSSAAGVLRRIEGDLANRRVSLAPLGEPSGKAEALSLDTPKTMARYAQMMTPQIRSALANNRRLEGILIALIVLLFVIASGLTIVGNFKSWDWTRSAAVIPGLGVTSAWPIRRLAQLRRENIQLETLPVLLPVLSADAAADVVKKLLGVK